MKKGLSLLALLLILLPFLTALDTTVNLISNEASFEKIENQPLILTYLFNTGEQINKQITSSKLDTTNFEDELFCYKNCNIVPKRLINTIQIKNGNNILSEIPSINPNPDYNQIINIYVSDFNNKNIIQQTNPENLINSIEWQGTLIINEPDNYSFFIDFSGILSFSIDEQELFNENLNSNIITLNLEKGNHSLEISYTTSQKNKLNLYWKTPKTEFSIIPEENLVFQQGKIKNALSLQLTSPESYEIDYSIYPTSVLGYYGYNPRNIPILLIHGLHGSDSLNPSDISTWSYWNDIPIQLRGFGLVQDDIWISYYTPANLSNFLTSGLLNNDINTILGFYYSEKLDIISHSMGGLITLGYIQGLGKNQSGSSINYSDNIRKAIFIGTPFHGSILANRILLNLTVTSDAFCESLGNSLGMFPKDEYAQAYLDLAHGSEFSELLNKPLISGIDYLAITGNTGIDCVLDETHESNQGAGSDGFVSVSSASLLDKNVSLIVLGDYDHQKERGQGLSGSFDAQKEVNIIKAFIKNQNPEIYLESLDYFITPNSPNPFSQGSLTIKTNDSLFLLSLKNIQTGERYHFTKFTDLRHNTNTNNWYYFSDNKIKEFYLQEDYNQKYGSTLPIGNYQIYTDRNPTDSYIEIKPTRTITKELFDFISYPCIPNLTIETNWSVCSLKDLQYKNWIDKEECNAILPLPLNQSCNFCSQNIAGPFYENSTCINNKLTITKYYLDLNYESCCLLTNLTSDCEINSKYKNTSATAKCSSPSQTKPKIIKTEPAQNDFTNGSDFYIKYSVYPMKDIIIFYGNRLDMYNQTLKCSEGTKQECSVSINISDFNQRTFYYWFKISDIFNNSVNSSKTQLKVDTIPPKILSINYSIANKYVHFKIKVNDTNFNKITYPYNNKTRILCNKLTRNKICDVTLYFAKGLHNLTITAWDDAGNTVQREISFDA